MAGTSPAELEALLPTFDVRERHSVRIRAPAERVYRLACEVDIDSIWFVRTIFRLRDFLLRTRVPPRAPQGFIESMRGLGWEVLLERPGSLSIHGAACKPWESEVVFRGIPPTEFGKPHPAGQVQIAWTIEVRDLGSGHAEFATETRAWATDALARRRFLRYWRWARFGIIPIRWALLGAIRRGAERGASVTGRK